MISKSIGGFLYGRVYGFVHRITNLIVILVTVSSAVVLGTQHEATPPASGTVRGTVVDARTGGPLPRVLVAIEGGPSAQSGPDGTFVLERIPAGGAGGAWRDARFANPPERGCGGVHRNRDRRRRSVRAAGADSLTADPGQRGAAEPARRADRRCLAGGAGVAGRGDGRRLPE